MARKSLNFTEEEIKALKEMAQEKIRFFKIFCCDEKGKPYPYRNRFETWEDAYNNLKALGFNHNEIIKRIGEKDVKK